MGPGGPLTFTESPNPQIVIRFVTGNHGDGSPFDGPGAVLAHAFYPPPNGGDIAGGDRPHLAYLAFGPPVEEGDTLLLALHGKVVPPAAGQHPLGLSGIQVRLRRVAGRWQAEEPPAQFAT